MPIRFALCNEVLRGWDWPRICRFAAEVGYDGLEVAPFTLSETPHLTSPQERSELRREAEAAGVRISGLHWLLVTPAGLHLTHPDEGIRARTSEFLRSMAGYCADLGGEFMVLGSPNQRSLLEGVTEELAHPYLMDALRLVLPELERRKVTLCLEPLPATETNFLNTMEEATQLASAVGSQWVRVVADVKSLCSEGSPCDLIRRYANSIAYVHANDRNRRGPGFGDVDFKPIGQALADISYEGWVSVEPFDYSPDPATIARQSLENLRTAFGSSGVPS
ncbi:MAG TPA: sugar phosphate isomerase/epimerase family protein [Armatimonadota bacterium]